LAKATETLVEQILPIDKKKKLRKSITQSGSGRKFKEVRSEVIESNQPHANFIISPDLNTNSSKSGKFGSSSQEKKENPLFINITNCKDENSSMVPTDEDNTFSESKVPHDPSKKKAKCEK